MATPSFFFSIFKKLQVCDYNITNTTIDPEAAGHFTPQADETSVNGGLSGGFRLTHPNDASGIFGKILTSNPPEAWQADLEGQPVLVTGSTTPGDNPLYVILSTCAPQNPAANFTGVPVPGNPYLWPPMPNFCQVNGGGGMITNSAWLEFTNPQNAITVVDALGTWIENKQINDEPQGDLYYPTLTAPAALPKAFPLPPDVNSTILFMCSEKGDNGRRPGDPMPVPAIPNFWKQSLIYLTDNKGNIQPTSANLIVSSSNAEFYVAAAIGNSGNINAGRLPASTPPAPQLPAITVVGYAMAFNTGAAPHVQLPSLSNIDGNITNMDYEQYFLAKQFYDVVGFRFNVNAVFAGLEQSLMQVQMNIGGLPNAAAWLEGGHVCVKVYIAAGETPSVFPANLPATTIGSIPATDRHIAQKNLGQFVVKPMRRHQVKWTNFVAAQHAQGSTHPQGAQLQAARAPAAAAGVNRLQIQHDLPADDFGFLLAMPSKVFEDYVRGCGFKGFAVERDPASKPFPDAVILREVVRGSFLDIADHTREPFLGLSLGVEYDSPKLKPGPIGTVSVVHFTEDGAVFGGFTLEVEMAEAGR
jgi:hypothetical protein